MRKLPGVCASSLPFLRSALNTGTRTPTDWTLCYSKNMLKRRTAKLVNINNRYHMISSGEGRTVILNIRTIATPPGASQPG